MSFNYYYSNYVIPTLIEANKEFFVKTILPNPNNMQIFIENEAFKFAIKNYTGDTVTGETRLSLLLLKAKRELKRLTIQSKQQQW